MLRRPIGDNTAARLPAFRTEVNDAIGHFDHIKVVLYYQHGVPRVDQALQHINELSDIFEMQACRRFVKDIERLARLLAMEFLSQLDTLGFPT